MNGFTEAGIAVAVINLVSLVGNIYWTLKFKSIQGNNEIIKSLTEQNVAKDLIIESKGKDLKTYKIQYNNLLLENQRLEAELKTYKKFHGHIKGE